MQHGHHGKCTTCFFPSAYAWLCNTDVTENVQQVVFLSLSVYESCVNIDIIQNNFSVSRSAEAGILLVTVLSFFALHQLLVGKPACLILG